MKRYIYLTLLLIILVGCKKDTDSKITSSGKPFIGGTDAIKFDFLEAAPPAEVYDGGEFPFEVTLSLENKGEWDVTKEDLSIKLSGFYPPDFNNPPTEKHPDEDLKGAYIDSEGNVNPGTITYVTFPNFKYMNELAGNNKFTIRADLCYKYGTKAQADICILDDLDAKDRVCIINEKKTVDVSSSPVQIEDFSESIGGSDKIRFQFTVVQRGSGLVSREGSNCNDELSEKNKVYVEIDTHLTGLTCSGFDSEGATSGTITLYSGKRIISCTQDISNQQGDFIKKVDLTLKFDYKEHEQIDLLVKHTVG